MISLHYLNRRYVDDGSRSPILSQPGHAKDLLHGLLPSADDVGSERLEAISLDLGVEMEPAGVLQPGHVHGVATESSNVDALVEHYVSIEAVVVPHLEEPLVFEPRLEFL